MTAQEILNIINADEEITYGCSVYGLRADRSGIEVGERFELSHQWWQDDPTNWDEDGEYEYNEDLGLWDGGELDGTCTIGLGDYPTVESIRAALERVSGYLYRSADTLYLVRGTSAEGGNDIGESIIRNARCAALI